MKSGKRDLWITLITLLPFASESFYFGHLSTLSSQYIVKLIAELFGVFFERKMKNTRMIM